ncbi:DNA-binding transcriptional activator GutM [Streptococcus varani]|uniref:DNA-binding transcriptional activator GutM n=1 Tax=Streptococcus varani TaxID=1608583 RepID=A0A0E4H3E4_9STRE|nr:transcriptional regulator GutM [Streptococcus varani]CQR23806.1 DNA-binding transcriptional activator GutM [Streptococcus varani]
MANLAIVLTVVILFQLVLTIYQIQHYQKFMASLVRKYQNTNDYQLVSEVVKSRFFSSIVALIYDKDKVIVEAYYLNGMTIFSKFKPYSQLVGQVLDKGLSSNMDDSKAGARRKAVEILVEKYA